MQNNDNNDATVNDNDDDDDDDCITVDNYEQDGGVQQQYNDNNMNSHNYGAGPPDKGTAVVSIQRQRRLGRMSVRRQTTNNYSLAQQHQHQLRRQRQQFRQAQN